MFLTGVIIYHCIITCFGPYGPSSDENSYVYITQQDAPHKDKITYSVWTTRKASQGFEYSNAARIMVLWCYGASLVVFQGELRHHWSHNMVQVWALVKQY
jgi:hypothetical protein